MGGKKAPEQPTTTANMGQFGSTTSGSFGSTWNPTSFQQQYVANAENAMLKNQALANSDTLAENKLNELNRQATTQFQNNLLMPALNRGLLRGSTAQDIGSVAQQNYANNLQSAIEAQQDRAQAQNQQALANYLSMYDVAKGVTGLSNSANQAASQYALSAAQINNNRNSALYGMIGNAIGSLGKAGGGAA